ncbi:MAG: 3-isopropylmalate dehydratase small subunit [Candidatus Omnitrophota bacterium]|nr:3-isopropylmalate dehydratase small subunit [Candidatus Omnitrophota bacterium]
MKLKGFAYKFGDNINTDLIISGRYKFSITDIKELSQHLFEDIEMDFSKKLKFNESIIVAGENFGMGSSREQAPLVLKEAGIIAVVAKSFARIFFRNSFNIGLPLIETDTSKINAGDELQIDLEKGILLNLSHKQSLSIKPLPSVMRSILDDGGLVSHFKKYGRFKI